MTTYTVKQTGGDYSTLNSALAAVSTGDIISIEGEWTVDDTVAAIVPSGVDNLTIKIGDSNAAHPGYWDTTQKHYRLVVSGNYHVVTINGENAVFDGLAIKQAGTGFSYEGFRVSNNGVNTIKNCLITSSGSANDQDGIFSIYSKSPTIHIENCAIWGWSRRGIGFDQATNNQYGTTTYNINSSTIWDNGSSSEALSCGIGVYIPVGTYKTVNVNVHNCIVVGNNYNSSGGDIVQTSGAIRITKANIDVSYSIDSDGSIGATGVDDNTGNLNSRTPTDDETPGIGDWVIFKDITTSPYDLRLVHSVENDAKDAHTTATAEGMTIPSYDIIGSSRPQQTSHDIGAFELVTNIFEAEGIKTGFVTGSPTIGQTHVLVVDEPITTPVTSSPTIGQKHNLIVSDLATGPPWTLIPELTVGHVLAITGLLLNPAIEPPSIGQTHCLVATGLKAGPLTGTPDITHGSLLATIGIKTTPLLGRPSLGQTHELTSSPVKTDPVVGTPSVGQFHSLMISGPLTTATIESPSLGQIHILGTSGIVANPVTTTPIAGVVYHLATTGIKLGPPVFTAASMAVTDILSVTDILMGPLKLGSPSIGQIHSFSPSDLEIRPIIGGPSIGQIHILSSRDVLGIPTIDLIPLTQTHIFTTQGLLISPVFDRTAFEATIGVLDIVFIVHIPDIEVTARYVDVVTQFYKPETIFRTYIED